MRKDEIDGATVGGLLDVIAGRRPDHEALVYPDRGLRQSYAEFNERVERVARALMALGLSAGDKVAVWGQNVPEWVTLQFATGKMGAVLVTVNPAYRSAELGYVLEQSDAVALFLTSGVKGADFVDVLARAVPELERGAGFGEEFSSEAAPFLRHVVLMGEGDRRGLPILTFEEFERRSEEVSAEELEERKASLSPQDVINMQYTSGTTGFPKGVQLTHENIIKNAFYIGECMKLGPEDRVCIPVPFFHCFGCVLGTLNTVTHEGTMVPVEQFDPEAVLKAVHEERCTAVLGVPTMFIAELEHPDFDRYDTSSLRTGIMAGSPCPIEVMRKVVDVMGADEITIAYGQTEASPVITQTRTDDSLDRRVSTVGRALPDVEVKIVDLDTGQPVGPGEQGDLCTRGYHVMRGYYKMEEKTREVIDDEGWLHTGDLAVMDEDGYVRITGRAKDMLIRGGENVYPREIEEFLYRHPKISDVQVYGVPDEKYGEEVAAAIKVRPGETLTEDEVREFCKGEIARYKIPRYIEFVEEYPMTASGKIQKYKLREAAVEKLGLRGAEEVETA
ncbi:Acyl-CoA synthetases (AMP-forming)/AMP-acid ligases II [Rubrobacter radiotolerans]|uniref:AMP-binding protein n=1 Tax=Rubrobacter radiotolerans TaxID=42256 RepID=A0A023X4I9_RUBRA|nr:AMP-binding protein [Rubrobacter radiotolerans]AHY46920.1 Acyl-CoA synthetases (AMP-forming)/AMP-acid ligases II [Rubrobacter radiotolerans]MDX5894325.1 AMP-binding protein [Rubrobacter radiotolerans]SMC05739.1 fatty-acyl-CoA synthase [Rubrobacter radiotolerans DSM 5868]